MAGKIQLGRIGPVVAMLVVLVVAALLGSLWGASSVQIVDTGPWQLGVGYQALYVQAVADAYAKDANEAMAIERLSFLCQQDGGLEAAFEQASILYGANPVESANLAQLRTLVTDGAVQQNPDAPVCNLRPVNNQLLTVGRLLAPVLLILMGVGIVLYGVFVVIRASETPTAAARPAAPAPASVSASTAPPSAGTAERGRATLPGIFGKKPSEQETVRSAAAEGAKISATVEKTDFTKVGAEPPIVQFMTTYLHGDDLYDDSFSIETPSGEFLGETGVGISETIGSGDTKNVTAFEVWLFDKNDIRTVTKVLMSDHAFNDDAIRAKLAPKGEAVLAKPGDRIMLETASLRVQARIVDLSYGSGPLPPNSFFSRLTIELAAWKREGQPVSRAAGLPQAPMGGGPAGPGTPPTGMPPFGGGPRP
jgi:hypothetical protein